MAAIPEPAREAARRGILSARWALLLNRPPADLRTIRNRQNALAALSRLNRPQGPRS